MIVRITAIIADLAFINRFGLSCDIDIAIILRIRDFFFDDKRKATEILATFFIVKATRIVPIADTSNI